MPGHRQERRANVTRWRKIRRAVLERDEHRCQIRILGVCTTIATCVHHTLGYAITGDDPAHLVAACAECNNRLGEPDNNDAQPRRTTQW
jgi:5-methylcytosine-specific restriction endonuclease McrA